MSRHQQVICRFIIGNNCEFGLGNDCIHGSSHESMEGCKGACYSDRGDPADGKLRSCLPLFEYEVLAAVAKEAEKEEEDDVKDSDLSL